MEGWQASLQHAAERRLAAAQDGIASDLRVALEEARSRIVAERAAHARALRVAQQQARADLGDARGAWSRERRAMEHAVHSATAAVEQAAAARGGQSSEAMAAIDGENARLHAT